MKTALLSARMSIAYTHYIKFKSSFTIENTSISDIILFLCSNGIKKVLETSYQLKLLVYPVKEVYHRYRHGGGPGQIDVGCSSTDKGMPLVQSSPGEVPGHAPCEIC